MQKFLQAQFAVIGGSGTYSINFPEDLEFPDISVIEPGIVYKTPYGESPPIKYFNIYNTTVAAVKMHGWRQGVDRATASQQVFWVFKKLGVKRIIAEGGVGSINHLLKPRDIIIPSDYIDFSMRKDISLGEPYLMIMREPVCPEISRILCQVAEEFYQGRVFDRGIYAVTDGRHFESRAEVSYLKNLGADIVGQSMCPEVYLAREIAACYGRLDLVVNYAEGVIQDWDYLELKDIFYNLPKQIGELVVNAIKRLDVKQDCGCPDLRKPTLLK